MLLSLRSSEDYRMRVRERKKYDDINLTCTRAHCYDNVFKCQRECTRPSLRNCAPSPVDRRWDHLTWLLALRNTIVSRPSWFIRITRWKYPRRIVSFASRIGRTARTLSSPGNARAMISSRRWFSNCTWWRIANCRAYLKRVACNSGKVTAGIYPIYVVGRTWKSLCNFLSRSWQIVMSSRDGWYYMGSVCNWCAIISLWIVRIITEKYRLTRLLSLFV